MNNAFIRICCFVFLATPLPALAQEDPPCLNPNNTILVKADDPSKGWLTRDGADVVKTRIWKVAGGARKRWDGGSLIINCSIGGGEAYEMTAVTVAGNGRDSSVAPLGKDFYSNLATRTGHTQQEADVLWGRYSKLSGFYRIVPDPDGEGTWISEDALIQRRIVRQLGGRGAGPASLAGNANREQRVAELKKAIEAAKKRGDRAELMRLATEGQQLAAPQVAAANQVSKQTDQQAWKQLELAYPELAKAAWPTMVTRSSAACVRCSWVTSP